EEGRDVRSHRSIMSRALHAKGLTQQVNRSGDDVHPAAPMAAHADKRPTADADADADADAVQDVTTDHSAVDLGPGDRGPRMARAPPGRYRAAVLLVERRRGQGQR